MESGSFSPLAPRLLFGLPFLLFAGLIGIVLSLALVAGSAPGCGGSAVSGRLSEKVPRRLVPIYFKAAAEYELGRRGPSILAAINWVETGFGANLGPSYAGAEGWMQFLPESWEAFGVDGDGDGDQDPNDPWDSIFAAANLLRESGAPEDWHGSLFSYNHAQWYVEKVERAAEQFGGAAIGSAGFSETICAAGVPSGAVLDRSVRLFSPRAFKSLPARLWIGGDSPQAVDARIWPDAVWLLEGFNLRVTAARESGHQTHGDGTAMDMVPAAGLGWHQTALRAALALGWTPSCGGSGTAPACPLIPAIQFVGYNGYPGHGDPAHVGSSAHLHVSWRSSDFGCPGLCEPRAWVEVFPWMG